MKTAENTCPWPRFWLALHCWLIAVNCMAAEPLYSVVERTPAQVGWNPEPLAQIEPLINAAIKRGDLPGAVVAIGRRGELIHLAAYGQRQVEPTPEAMTTDTIFDLASLTKPVVTGTLSMKLIEQGKLQLDSPVSRYLPNFIGQGRELITIEQLLTHTSGLIADNSLKDYSGTRTENLQKLLAQKPSTPGKTFTYSDVGFMLQGLVIETITQQRLDEVARAMIFAPLGMKETTYNPDPTWQSRIAPTTKEAGLWLRGKVHDPRAAKLDGVAGHAGLFSSARDLALYAQIVLDQPIAERNSFFQAETLKTWLQPRRIPDPTKPSTGRLQPPFYRTLGWDQHSLYSTNRGTLLTQKSAVGHGGFTGTALWIDREQNLFVIFLSNRLHPDGQGSVNTLAGEIADLAVRASRGKKE
jgi:serine-type D-Ala-D-Ala carboxypeptidase